MLQCDAAYSSLYVRASAVQLQARIMNELAYIQGYDVSQSVTLSL